MVQPEGKGFLLCERILLPVTLQRPDPVSLVLLGKKLLSWSFARRDSGHACIFIFFFHIK